MQQGPDDLLGQSLTGGAQSPLFFNLSARVTTEGKMVFDKGSKNTSERRPQLFAGFDLLQRNQGAA